MPIHPVDKHVGKKLRALRWARGLNQENLAKMIGVRFQQVQKYETGANRIAASRLKDAAEALSVPVSFFFEGLGRNDSGGIIVGDLLLDKKAVELAQMYNKIPLPQRQKLLELARQLEKDAKK